MNAFLLTKIIHIYQVDLANVIKQCKIFCLWCISKIEKSVTCVENINNIMYIQNIVLNIEEVQVCQMEKYTPLHNLKGDIRKFFTH